MSSRPGIRIVRLLAWLLLWPAGAALGAGPPAAAVASAHPLATRAGQEILAQGGNAFDAAVAVAAVLGVVEPAGSGLGGGGFFLLYRARDGRSLMLDARERAPLAATADMYLDAAGEPVPRASLDGPLAAAVPGVPAALAHLARRYGRLPLARSLAPAIRHAREGFPVTPRYRRLARLRRAVLRSDPEAGRVFLRDGEVPALGTRIRQPALAGTLAALARDGRRGFYEGPVARRLVAGVRAGGGIWSLEDLRRYRVLERAPVQGQYHRVRITAAALPSSGGVVLVQMLNMLSAYPLERLPRWQRAHYIIEAMRRAYRERAAHLGDPDFVDVDVARLLSPAHARRLGRDIRPDRATPSAALPPVAEGRDTTHFSVLDRAGNRVAATLSINYPFGSGFMPAGTGVVLNNEMDDFVIKPGVPNVYGLVGNRANAIAPGKRPLSSMTPTFLEDGERVAILGTPGGSRIISMVLLATLEFAAGRGGPGDWVALPRFHHQYLPDMVTHEPAAFGPQVRRRLQRAGHRLQEKGSGYGNMQLILWDKDKNTVSAASDPRGEGLALVR